MKNFKIDCHCRSIINKNYFIKHINTKKHKNYKCNKINNDLINKCINNDKLLFYLFKYNNCNLPIELKNIIIDYYIIHDTSNNQKKIDILDMKYTNIYKTFKNHFISCCYNDFHKDMNNNMFYRIKMIREMEKKRLFNCLKKKIIDS